jgi:hypothetical protein
LQLWLRQFELRSEKRFARIVPNRNDLANVRIKVDTGDWLDVALNRAGLIG